MRPPAIYGPEDFGMLPVFKTVNFGFLPVLGFLPSYASFIYIDDIIRALGIMIEKRFPTGSVFTIDDGSFYSHEDVGRITASILKKKAVALKIPLPLLHGIAQITNLTGKLLKKSFILNPDKVRELEERYWICGYEKLEEIFDFIPEFNLQAGLEKTLAWYKENGFL